MTCQFAVESAVMGLFRRAHLDAIAWALRRFHTPVGTDALVLEVGSGGNPYPRSNVLLDAYEMSRERHWARLATDRPTVLGFAENLPFRDGAFDYVIAAHVLEHSPHPELFLTELQRVANAGYIEVPDAFLERVNPYRDHRLEITCRNHTLVISKKSAWCPHPEVIELYEDRVKPVMTRQLVPQHPFEFHVRFYWQNQIHYRIINPEVDAAWPAPTPEAHCGPAPHSESPMREFARSFLRNWFSQRRRNSRIDLLPLLRCTACGSTSLRRASTSIDCGACTKRFPVRNGVVVTNEGEALHG